MKRSGPPFQSVYGAVRWSFFTTQRPLLKSTSIYSVSPSDSDLSPTERTAQAAMIIRVTEEILDPVQLAYVRVVWLAPGKLTGSANARRRGILRRRAVKQQHWQALIEKQENKERLTRAEILTLSVGSPFCAEDELPYYFTADADQSSWSKIVDTLRHQMPACKSSRGVEKLIRRYRGDLIGVHAMRKDLRCAMADVEKYLGDASEVLGRMDERIVYLLEPGFLEAGWVLPHDQNYS